MFDALVIGAGPAGSAAARLLAQAGWRIALVEKAEFPRRKVCGEFISATTMPVLASCGIADTFLAAAGPPVTQVGLYAGEAMLADRCDRVWGRALGREHLDTMLRDAAVAAGAQLFQPAEIVSVEKQGENFAGALDNGAVIAARHVIAACGSWNPRGPFAVSTDDAKSSDLFAFKAHFSAGRLPAGLMPLLAFPGGYGGLVMSDHGRTSLSCCIRRAALTHARQRHGGRAAEAVLAHILETTKGARAALGAAALDGAFLSVGPIHPGIRPRLRDGVFCTGNIAGEAHPVIAEGISMAIQSSGLLAKLLIAHRGEDYAHAWTRRFATRIRAASVFAHLAMRGPTRAASLAVIKRAPVLLGWGARLSGKTPISA
ncbi:MAG TPA: FAD-dependent monooxygenase [Rhizomicrobium sp.]